ncbi:MAG: helix-turn-helix domain-containing protein [Planctomycetota bacterium]
MNNTLANGLSVLGFLSQTAASFGVSELATQLKLPKSHVHRLLQTLVETGYVVQQEDRRYRIGLRPLEISCALLHNLPLRSAALPSLHHLAKTFGLDAFVAIPHQGAGLIVAAVYADGRQRDPAASIGTTLKMGTATWKLFTACVSDFGSSPLTATELKQIRRERFVVKDPDLGVSMGNGMAALVSDLAGNVHGAICSSGPGDEFRRGFKQNAALLRATADKLGATFPVQASAKAST